MGATEPAQGGLSGRRTIQISAPPHSLDFRDRAGLEFDRVIVPEADADNYANDMERNLLYGACSRAMHRLSLTHTKAPSPWLHP